jgi:hypothetical protein
METQFFSNPPKEKPRIESQGSGDVQFHQDPRLFPAVDFPGQLPY